MLLIKVGKQSLHKNNNAPVFNRFYGFLFFSLITKPLLFQKSIYDFKSYR